MAYDRERYERWIRETPAEGRKGIPAATVILLRDGEDGIETLMLRRNSRLAFVGGMWVFPGGRVDPEDEDPAAPDDVLATARRAAVREAQEESGLDVDLGGLVTFSHWTPPAMTPKRFLTWFFLAAAPAGSVTIDGGEIHDHRWIRPAEAMLRRNRGEIEVAPPTWITLDQLSRYARVQDALERCAAAEPEFFETRIALTDACPVALYSGDAGYESGDPDAPGGRHRLVMRDDGWSYERS